MDESTNTNIPKWINVDYFKPILKNDGEDYRKIMKFTPVAAIGPGENFVSVMLRIHLDLELKDGSKKHKTYVMKTMLEDEAGSDVIERLELFPKELDMYGIFLPAFEKLYKDAGKPVQFAPRCLLTETKGNRMNFVFEDLSVKGYRNVDRIKGLNMDQMSRALQKLAEFHAASVVYYEQRGPYPEKYKFGFVQETDYAHQKELFEMRIIQFKEAMKGWGLKDVDKYFKKLLTFEQCWKCMMKNVRETSRNSFNVLNHADFWSSNVMYTFLENGTVDDVMLLDFQMCKWGSPVEDLIFMITVSAAKDIRIKEYEHFVAIYHERLVECLKVLNYKNPLPKLRDLQMDMYRDNNTFYAMYSVLNHLPLILLPPDKDSTVASFYSPNEDGQRFRRKIYTNPHYKAAMLDILPFYYNRGIFNFTDFDE
uniref:Uncharacterized oxidoreductase dhs-27 n=1 Tax=Zeugodacus cucurbitae TaxID=28588 RepID=A0A0A1XS26_ZEUCU